MHRRTTAELPGLSPRSTDGRDPSVVLRFAQPSEFGFTGFDVEEEYAQQLLLPNDLLWAWAAMPGMTLADAIGRTLEQWERRVAEADLSEQTLEKFGLLLARFCLFAEAQGHHDLDDVDQRLVTAFVFAKGRDRHGAVIPPSASTARLRAAVLRGLFREAQALGITVADPTLKLELPARPARAVRPLTDDEVALCRLFSARTTRHTRHQAVLALALAGAHSGEIGQLTLGDLDLSNRRVWAHGSTKHTDRWVRLDDWAAQVVLRRSDHVRSRTPHASGQTPLIGGKGGSDASVQAGICGALREVFEWAGLAEDPNVRPASVTAWRGIQVFAGSGRVEQVALALGLRSLDNAARTVGYLWAQEPADPQRQSSARLQPTHDDQLFSDDVPGD